jgi:hypothetical protein
MIRSTAISDLEPSKGSRPPTRLALVGGALMLLALVVPGRALAEDQAAFD